MPPGVETSLTPAARLVAKAAFSSPLDLDATRRENAYFDNLDSG